MASAQVLRKQEHLEAGKRKLEEFRKKKAAEKAKKTTSTSQFHAYDVQNEKHPSGTERACLTDSNGVGTTGAPAKDHSDHSGVIPNITSKDTDILIKSDFSSSSDTNAEPSLSARNNDISSSFLERYYLNNEENKDGDASMGSDGYRSFKYNFQARKDDDGSSAQVAYGFGNDHTLAYHVSSTKEACASSHVTYRALGNYSSNNTAGYGNDISRGNSGPSAAFTSDILRKNPVSTLLPDKLRDGGHEFNSLTSSPYQGEADKSDSKLDLIEGLRSSLSQQPGNSSVAFDEGVGLFNNVVENKHGFFSQKQNEDFAALEQHIEDLTQEKFSLLRALDASRSLGESLASENSALTDSFNQQGGVVNQLKFDLEKLQEEIKARLVELEAIKVEYANAQLECNAADERAKLLAAEVIGLEEKALRLRSNELKLERQLENTKAEISSYRRKMLTLEKDRQDLLSTIDALQEEKKLLQCKLQKDSSGGVFIDFNRTSHNKQNVSTSTEDLATDLDMAMKSTNSDNLGTALHGGDTPGCLFSHENTHLTLEGLPKAVPPDQIRMIQNINALIAELALEKDQLVQALSAKSSQSSKLLELNKELSRKLEAQTQRLELLTAQSMATDNPQPRQLDSRTVHESTTYADEGDEVVERVLGWILQLFPGGSSRRRPTKHLLNTYSG